jgi:transposase
MFCHQSIAKQGRQLQLGRRETGTLHDRDVNAAINTLTVGAGIALERICSNG